MRRRDPPRARQRQWGGKGGKGKGRVKWRLYHGKTGEGNNGGRVARLGSTLGLDRGRRARDQCATRRASLCIMPLTGKQAVRSKLCTAAAVVDSMMTEATEGEEGGSTNEATGTRETEGG